MRLLLGCLLFIQNILSGRRNPLPGTDGITTYEVNIRAGRCDPKCKQFQQTGKVCKHLQAARIARVAGPVDIWNG